MRTSLGTLMAQLSQESSQTEQVGAEEILVITEEATTELEEAIEDLAEAVNDKADSDTAVEKVLEATVSLESNMALLDTMISAGQPLSGTAFAIWQNGLRESFEARQIPDVIWAGAMDSVVTSFEADGDADQSGEAKEAGKSILQRLGDMLKKAWEWAKEAWGRLTGNIKVAATRLDTAAQALKKAAGEASSGSKVGEVKIKSSAYKSLATAGKVDVSGRVTAVQSSLGEHKTKALSLLASIESATKALEAGTDLEGVTNPYADGMKVHTGEGAYELKIADGKFIKSMTSIKLEKVGAKETAPAEANSLTVTEVLVVAGKISGIAKEIIAVTDAIDAQFKKTKAFKAAGKDNADLAKSIAAAVKVSDVVTSKVMTGGIKVARDAYSFARASLKARSGSAPAEVAGTEEDAK